jgi:hypothetical protein
MRYGGKGTVTNNEVVNIFGMGVDSLEGEMPVVIFSVNL